MGKQTIKKKPAGWLFPSAKKGKTRLMMKNNLTKKPASKKANSRAWAAVPYVRGGGVSVRRDQEKWSKTLQDILHLPEKTMVELLIKDGLLPEWKGAQCPMCNKGILSGLQARGEGQLPRYRCRSKNCHKFVTPQHLRPIFTTARGPEGHSLGVQASVLLLRLANVPLSTILLGVNHKAVERLDRGLNQVRKHYVEDTPKTMTFKYPNKKWLDIEVDEATFDKSLVPLEDAEITEKRMKWEQWVGLVTRGKPESLVLLRLNPQFTTARAPGPGAIRKTEWKPIAKRWLKDTNVVLHSDSARSYKGKISGVLHDAVIHQKKKMKVNGKWVWKLPKYVTMKTHTLPSGKKIKTKAGTQVIDRAWKFLKERVKVNQNSKAGSVNIRAKIRSAQYEYWCRGKDMWSCAGKLLTWHMSKIVQKP